MPSRAWVVTQQHGYKVLFLDIVSMPSRAWVVTNYGLEVVESIVFQCPLGLELLPSGLEVPDKVQESFNALSGLSCYGTVDYLYIGGKFQCPLGLELLLLGSQTMGLRTHVSMPSRAWVVTARMPNILNFSWCFLCIPAIYRCILAHLPIFFNQLSKFLRCESPSTFLGTCLLHHSFIIFLVTNTNTLLSGLYLISTALSVAEKIYNLHVSMPSRAYTSFLRYLQWHMMQCITMCQCPLGLIPHFYDDMPALNSTGVFCVNALSGLYLISTLMKFILLNSPMIVSMPSRAYTSFLRYPFKNLGFMRFPEPVFAGIYQNILTTAVFRAC